MLYKLPLALASGWFKESQTALAEFLKKIKILFALALVLAEAKWNFLFFSHSAKALFLRFTNH